MSDRVLTAASTGLLLLLLPLGFVAAEAAGASLAPSPDSARTALAVLAAVPLLLAAAGVTTVVALRRAAGHPRPWHPVRSGLWLLLGACAAAASLVQSATGGQFRWSLSVLGAAGVVLVLRVAAAYRPGTALGLAAALAVVLVGTGVVRDRPQGELRGPPPATSPGLSPATPPTVAPPPR